MRVSEILAFALYFAVMLGIGFYFMRKMGGGAGEEEYFLGSRSLGPWVTGLSAQASDMSGWGCPAASLWPVSVRFGSLSVLPSALI